MITDIFKDIWRGKISRIFLLIAVSLIFIGLTLRAKIPIYNFFYRAFVGEVFFDPYTYKKGEYGFTEKPDKSEKLLKKGIKQLVKQAADLYNMPYPETIFLKNFDHGQSWEKAVSDEAIELVYMVFHDLELFCVPFHLASSADTMSENLEKRYQVRRKSPTEPIQYAIKDGEFMKYSNWLLDLDRSYFYLSLQKKPDSIAVLNLRKGLLKAVCKPQNISFEMTSALEYREYKTEKEIYYKNRQELPDVIAAQTLQTLKKDTFYHKLLREQFMESYFLTRNVTERLQQSYNYYILQQADIYLESYMKTILEYARISGLEENRKTYNRLLAMKTEKLKNNSTYLYTLAEISFRAHQYDDTRNYLEELTLHHNLAGSDLYRIKRLDFLLNLLQGG